MKNYVEIHYFNRVKEVIERYLRNEFDISIKAMYQTITSDLIQNDSKVFSGDAMSLIKKLMFGITAELIFERKEYLDSGMWMKSTDTLDKLGIDYYYRSLINKDNSAYIQIKSNETFIEKLNIPALKKRGISGEYHLIIIDMHECWPKYEEPIKISKMYKAAKLIVKKVYKF